MSPEETKAKWIAAVAVASGATMPKRDHLLLLGSFYDQAFLAGINDEIKRDIVALKAQTAKLREGMQS